MVKGVMKVVVGVMVVEGGDEGEGEGEGGGGEGRKE